MAINMDIELVLDDIPDGDFLYLPEGQRVIYSPMRVDGELIVDGSLILV